MRFGAWVGELQADALRQEPELREPLLDPEVAEGERAGALEDGMLRS